MQKKKKLPPRTPPETLLDLDRLPTKDELRDFFRKNDWTAAKPYDLSKLNPDDAGTAVYVKDVFNSLWDQSAARHGQKSPPKCFTKDYPPEVLKDAVGDIVAGKVTEILNDDKQLETILTPFFEKGNEEERADPFVSNAMDTLLDTVGYGDILAAAKEIGTVEDFSKRPINYPRRDFEDKWNHPRAKTKIAFSSNAADNALEQEENQIHDEVEDNLFVQDFFKRLDPTDAKIVRLAMDGFTHEQIAEKLGFKTHSAVTKRLQKLRPVFIKYSREQS